MVLMELSLKQILGISAAVLVLGLVLFNGLAMLASPRRWFDMPDYLALRGSIRRDSLSTWLGRLQVRMLGLIVVAFIVFVITSVLTHGRGAAGQPPGGHNEPDVHHTLSLAYLALACIGAGVWGTMLLVRPRWYAERYVEKYVRPRVAPVGKETGDSQTLLVRVAQISGILLLGISAYLGWSIGVQYSH